MDPSLIPVRQTLLRLLLLLLLVMVKLTVQIVLLIYTALYIVASAILVYFPKTDLPSSLRSRSNLLALLLGLDSDLAYTSNFRRRWFRVFKSAATFLAVGGEHWGGLATFHAAITPESPAEGGRERDLRGFPCTAGAENRLRRYFHGGRGRKARGEANEKLARCVTAAIVAVDATATMGSICVHHWR